MWIQWHSNTNTVLRIFCSTWDTVGWTTWHYESNNSVMKTWLSIFLVSWYPSASYVWVLIIMIASYVVWLRWWAVIVTIHQQELCFSAHPSCGRTISHLWEEHTTHYANPSTCYLHILQFFILSSTVYILSNEKKIFCKRKTTRHSFIILLTP